MFSNGSDVVETLRAGDSFGECMLAVPEGVPFKYRVTVRASKSSHVMIMSRDDLYLIGGTCNDLETRFLEVLDVKKCLEKYIYVSKKYKDMLDGADDGGTGLHGKRMAFTGTSAIGAMPKRRKKGRGGRGKFGGRG